MQTNKNYDNLEQSYLFSTIARKVREYSEAHPEADIIRLGIGDVTRPLVPAVIDALHAAVEDQAKQETFHGYGDEQGYGFLHEALVGYYKSHGVELATNEIFISDGAKSDLGNILDIFGTDNTVLVPDPVYPVYVDTNVMAGRKIVFADANEANGFLPLPDESVQCDIIYICSPNNPTGAVFSKEEVSEIARLAKKYDVAILADELYSRQILEKDFTYTHMRSLPEKPDKLITIMGPSKTESLSGFRLGVGYGTPEIITRMEKLQAVVSLRCAGYNQAAFYRWFSEPEGWMEKRIADHRQIRDDILKVINSCPGCWARPTEGGSYIFMQLPKLKVDIFQFTKLCRAQASVTVTPGTEFGKQYSDFIRMNFSQDHDRAVDAVKRICEMVDRYRV